MYDLETNGGRSVYMEKINTEVKCVGTMAAYFDENGKIIPWTIGKTYDLNIYPDENIIELENDNGLLKHCLIGFPSIILKENFNYDISDLIMYCAKLVKDKKVLDCYNIKL